MDEQKAGRDLHRYRSKLAKQAAEIKRLRGYLEHAIDVAPPDPDCPECAEIREYLGHDGDEGPK